MGSAALTGISHHGPGRDAPLVTKCRCEPAKPDPFPVNAPFAPSTDGRRCLSAP
jgi:hypothetical protein